MSTCTYYLKGSERSYTYEELLEEILLRIQDGLQATDIVFSKSSPELYQRSIAEGIKNLSVEAKRKSYGSYIDGEPELEVDGAIGTQQFIDSHEFRERGGTVLTLVREDYIKETTEILKVKEGLSEELALDKARQMVENWDIIGDDAVGIHTLIGNFDFRRPRYEFIQEAKGTKLESCADKLYDSIEELIQNQIFGRVKTLNGLPSILLSNVNLKAALTGLDKDLVAHIDLMAIDGEGTLHIYNYKTTTTAESDWSDVKRQKYKYQLSFIKRILQSKGYDVKNIELNLVPIRIKYNEDMTTIVDAFAEKPINYSIFSKRNGGIGNALAKEDSIVQRFIDATVNFNQVTAEDHIPVNEQLAYIFPEKNIKASGLEITVNEWIESNFKDGGRIRRVLDPDFAYEIFFSEDDVVMIPKEFSDPPLKNTKIKEEVAKRTSLLNKNDSEVMNHVIRDIKSSYRRGYCDFSFYGPTGTYLNTLMRPYFETEINGEKKTPLWEFVENDILNGANILVFRNVHTGQLDFIQLSPYNIRAKARFKKSNDHILGSHLYKQNVGSLINYKPTFGNIEAVRGALLINQILPKLTGEWKLGKLHVISLESGGQGNVYGLETLNKDLVTPLINFMNENPSLSVTNNYINQQYIDPLEILITEYKGLLNNTRLSIDEKQELIDLGFDHLESADTVEAKRTALMDLALSLQSKDPGFLMTKNLEGKTHSGNPAEASTAKLYKLILQALRYYEVPEVSSIEEKLGSLNSNMFVSSKVPNKNFLIIQDVFTKAIDNVAAKVLEEIQKSRQYFATYYDKCGYSRLENALIGDQAKAFDRLYKRDDSNNRLLELKDPYNPAEDLKDYEREFLKKVLLSFNRIRSMMKGAEFVYTDPDSEALKHYAETHQDYFNIPLEKASSSTRNQNTGIREKCEYGWNMMKTAIKDPKQAYDLFVSKLPEEEVALRNESIDAWQLRNKFDRGERDRAEYIASRGTKFFESNLEKLLIDFTEKYYEHREFNKALIISKAVEFELELLRGQTNNEAVIKETIEKIDNFLKPNVFGASIMEETSQKIVGMLHPLKEVVSKTLIAGNIIGSFRDVFEGIWQNAMRTINHYQTDIDMPSLLQGYKTVVENSFTDPRSINIVNQLCLKFRLSNIDVARISEGLKTEGGVYNYNDWIYATLRKPDFLNRMVLFVAKCYKDGVYNAFSINENGELEYDWKKDKRFEIFAKGLKSDPKYVEQMGAYYNAVRAYNQDNPDNPISFDGNQDPLPQPYSQKEIETMKNLANSIYGSYDKSTRAAYEHMAIGTIFGMFSTWMNGIYTNYMMKPGQYNNTDFELVQAKNASGKLLYFDNLGNLIYEQDGKYYYDGEDIEATENITSVRPVMDKVPIVVQGIWYTLKDSLKALSNGDFKEEIWMDPMQRKNLDKLFSDLLATLIFSAIFGFVITPAYKEFKKDMPNKSIVTNGVVELLYKSSSRSYDGFRGMLNVIEYLGENTTPPIYSQNIKLISDLGKTIFGDKTMGALLTGNIAVFKTFQDTYKAELKK